MLTDYTKRTAGFASYIPAAPPGYSEFPVALPKNKERALPAGLSKSDLNFLKPESTLLHYDKALVSAGLVLGKNSTRIPKPMISDLSSRAPGTTILWDSSGFQLIDDKVVWRGDETRRLVLQACEYYADVAASLDIPPFQISKQFPTYEVSRDTTVASLKYYDKHRRRGPKPLFLNSLHGLTPDQCDDWYRHVKYFPMEGWAFGSLYKRRLSELLRRLIVILNENLMDGRSWMHVFGTNRLPLACALTTIQTVLSRLMGRFVQVSYDTSSPFTMAYKSRLAYLGYAIDKSAMVMKHCRFPNWDASIGKDELRFPTLIPTAISNRLVLSDICLPDSPTFAPSSWDDPSYHLIANHNLEVLFNAIVAVHRIYLLDENNAAGLCPDWLIRTRIGIEEVLTSQTPMDALAKYTADFDKTTVVGRSISAIDLFTNDNDTQYALDVA